MKRDIPAEAPWRMLGRVMGAGALFDGAFAAAILGPTRLAASLLGLEVPGDPFYLYLNGVLLLLLAGLYALPSVEPRRYHLVAPVSAAGRILGFALFVWGWWGGRPIALLALGLCDLGIGGVTLGAWIRTRRVAPSA
jgi:hypothetical protein